MGDQPGIDRIVPPYQDCREEIVILAAMGSITSGRPASIAPVMDNTRLLFGEREGRSSSSSDTAGLCGLARLDVGGHRRSKAPDSALGTVRSKGVAASDMRNRLWVSGLLPCLLELFDRPIELALGELLLCLGHLLESLRDPFRVATLGDGLVDLRLGHVP